MLSFIRPEFKTSRDWPLYNYYNIPKKNVEIEEQKKTLQVSEKVQKVFGFESSKANRDPPIGAPKAAETPAAPPIARNFLLSVSFLKFLRKGRGR